MTFDEAKEHLKDVATEDGGLYSLGWYLSYNYPSKSAILDGDFSADDLIAIGTFMKGQEALAK